MNWLRRLWNGSDLPRDKHGRVIEPRDVRNGGRGELPPSPATPPREWTLAERQRMVMVETENGPISPEAWHSRRAQQRRPTPAEAMREANAARNMEPMPREWLAAMSEHERLTWWHSRRVYTPIESLGSPHESTRWAWRGPDGDEEI